ncbi:MAG TPA: class I SAM-dependent methyltransferase [Methylibium sp.]|uniref:class I SAM-dependent methyltransferase n=1 Tax=Methylibium sp. TaxID=2067992 RepID=UPI002DB71C34|nr:class I SAM-dependent methyltransferase [Methylibium sp.]HEU4457626.1 class I SAM-dependent methyltransferase [Methylibium sp.]
MAIARDIDDYQQAYAASDFEPTMARLRKRVLLAALARWRPRRVLEVGCADDALFNHHADFEHWCVVEPGAGFAALARQHAQRRGFGERVRVVQALLEDAGAELAGGDFDLILLSGLLHEVPQPAALLAATAALCTPATRVHVNVPNARSLHRLLALEMGLIDSIHAISDQQRALQQTRTYDLDTLSAACRDAGFAIEASGSYFIKPFTHRQMAGLARDGLLDERMLDGLCGLERHLPGLGAEIHVDLRLAAAGS